MGSPKGKIPMPRPWARPTRLRILVYFLLSWILRLTSRMLNGLGHPLRPSRNSRGSSSKPSSSVSSSCFSISNVPIRFLFLIGGRLHGNRLRSKRPLSTSKALMGFSREKIAR